MGDFRRLSEFAGTIEGESLNTLEIHDSAAFPLIIWGGRGPLNFGI
jgi:hypothetical protein